MNDGLMTVEEVAARVGWEGGILDTIEYGLISANEIADPELARLWAEAEEAAAAFTSAVARIENYLEEYGFNEDE